MSELKRAASANLYSAGCHDSADTEHQMPSWASDISSGVSDVDGLHRGIFSALDQLSDCDDRNFCAQFAEFVGKVERAFREEEAWMDDLEGDFATIPMHQEQHARVLGALHHVHGQVMAGDLATGRYVIDELLPQWLLLHISALDTPLANAMQLARSEHQSSLQPS